VIIFWPPPGSGGLYWIRSAIGGVLAWFDLWDLKVAIFATEEQIWRAVAGDVDVWKETGVAAPSAFKIKEVIFLFVALVMLLLAIGVIGRMV
jgi:hypothetical protein